MANTKFTPCQGSKSRTGFDGQGSSHVRDAQEKHHPMLYDLHMLNISYMIKSKVEFEVARVEDLLCCSHQCVGHFNFYQFYQVLFSHDMNMI